jgi:hypothetical protein
MAQTSSPTILYSDDRDPVVSWLRRKVRTLGLAFLRGMATRVKVRPERHERFERTNLEFFSCSFSVVDAP